MGSQIGYESFLRDFDEKIEGYFQSFRSYVGCRKGCSSCCERGDYPISDIELEYLMKGYSELDCDTKILVQNNFKTMKKGGKCPFLLNKECSVYYYRPIVCRVHGLAYIYKDKTVKVPYCANQGKCYINIYKDGEFNGSPIEENLETYYVLKRFNPVIKNLYDWLFVK